MTFRADMPALEEPILNPTETTTVSVGFLLSGGGRTLENLIEQIEAQGIPASIALVIASKAGIGGIDKAKKAGIPTEVHSCRDPQDSAVIFESLEAAGCQYAILGGWLRKLEIPSTWEKRVINIHPSLLPRHGGKGCYGDRVHRRGLPDPGRRLRGAGRRLESGCDLVWRRNLQQLQPVLWPQRARVSPTCP